MLRRVEAPEALLGPFRLPIRSIAVLGRCGFIDVKFVLLAS